jgi:NADH dehydrogenase
VTGEPDPGPFVYRDWGTMATIGRASAVGDFRRLRVTGFVAWLLWGLVHIAYLIGFRNRLVVTINWLWAWLTYAKGARLITGDRPPAPDIARRAARRAGEKLEIRSEAG